MRPPRARPGLALCTLLALAACAPLVAPPPACSGDNCSNGTPRFNSNPTVTDGSTTAPATDAGDAAIATADGGRAAAVRGSVGEARILPRVRAEDTVAAAAWDVSGLLGPGAIVARTDRNGLFSVTAELDDSGAIPLRAQPSPPAFCAIGGAVSAAESAGIIAVSPTKLAEVLAPTGITIDPRRAHVVVEIEDALRNRTPGVRVGRTPGGPVTVAYDTDGAGFAVVESTGPLGTAVIMNLEPPDEPVRIGLVLQRETRARTVPIYVARGCVTFVTALAP